MQLFKLVAISLASAGLAAAARSKSLTVIINDVEKDTHKLTKAVERLDAKQLATAKQLQSTTLDLVYSLNNATAITKKHNVLKAKHSATVVHKVKKIAKDVKIATSKISKEAKQIKGYSAKEADEIAESLKSIGREYGAWGKQLEKKVVVFDEKGIHRAFSKIQKGFYKVAYAFQKASKAAEDREKKGHH